jgi:hypothetical protein
MLKTVFSWRQAPPPASCPLLKELLSTLIFTMAIAAIAASPLRAQNDTAAKKASISGRVVREESGTPLARVNVVLRPAPGSGGGGTALSATTDAAGHFRIPGIAAGGYRLQVSRDGFVPQEFGAKTAGGVGAILTLAAGQEMDDLLFRLQSGGVISGRVTDENGDPLPHVEVQILRKSGVHGSMRISRDELPADTDDRGEYRVFDLLPGHYFAAASYSPGIPLENAKESAKYAPSFYPGSNDLAHASSIEVAAGQEISSIDFVLRPSRVVRVRGSVLNGMTGKPAKGASVTLQPAETAAAQLGLDPLNGVAGADGSFEIASVPPGSYLAVATLEDQSRQYFARQNVDVGPAGLDALSLVISPGINVPGRVTYGDKADTPTSETSVILRSGEDFFTQGRTAPLNTDGTFVAKNVSAGMYQVDLRPTCGGCYLKSAKMAGVDVLQGGLDLTAGVPRGELVILVSASAGTVDGTVTNGDDLPVAGALVALVPEAGHRKEGRLYKESTTDQYGGFNLRGVTPGNYKVFAWDGAQDVTYRDPEFMKSLDGQGTEVHVEENAESAVKLKAIPAANAQ